MITATEPRRTQRIGLISTAALWGPISTTAMAALITAMLLNTIRNEWDLVTWLAPHPDSAEAGE